MSNALKPRSDHKPSTSQFKLSQQSLRAVWADFLTLASLGVCAWFLAKTVFQFWR